MLFHMPFSLHKSDAHHNAADLMKEQRCHNHIPMPMHERTKEVFPRTPLNDDAYP